MTIDERARAAALEYLPVLVAPDRHPITGSRSLDHQRAKLASIIARHFADLEPIQPSTYTFCPRCHASRETCECYQKGTL